METRRRDAEIRFLKQVVDRPEGRPTGGYHYTDNQGEWTDLTPRLIGLGLVQHRFRNVWRATPQLMAWYDSMQHDDTAPRDVIRKILEAHSDDL